MKSQLYQLKPHLMANSYLQNLEDLIGQGFCDNKRHGKRTITNGSRRYHSCVLLPSWASHVTGLENGYFPNVCGGFFLGRRINNLRSTE
jgi:hypothetical protein